MTTETRSLAAIAREIKRDDMRCVPMKTCLKIDTIIPQWPIKLQQRGIDRFRVTYGLQIDDNLSYEHAALKLGAAIMHALACEGKLDNRESRNES